MILFSVSHGLCNYMTYIQVMSAGALFIKMCNHVDFIVSYCECNIKIEESSVI